MAGTAEFIGHAAAHRLLDRGERVIGVDIVNDYHDPELKQARLKTVENRNSVTFYKLGEHRLSQQNQRGPGCVAGITPMNTLNIVDQSVSLACMMAGFGLPDKPDTPAKHQASPSTRPSGAARFVARAQGDAMAERD